MIILEIYIFFLYNQSMKNKRMKIITGVLVAIWMAVVFAFSNEPSVQTQSTSGNVTEKIVNIISKVVNIPEEKKENTIQRLNPYIRKIAHYLLYTLGGIFIIISMNQYNTLSENKKIIISLIIGIVYSISDEIHQYFIRGRACQIIDVYLDSLGIATGVFLVLFFIKIYENNKFKIYHK